jgi:hypothetical protein
MKFDLTATTNQIREQLKAALNRDVNGCVHRNAYQTALAATTGIPGRQVTIAYVLGITAGVEFDVHDTVPSGSIFNPGTREADDYASGIKDALLIAAEYQRVMPSAPDALSVFFESHRAQKIEATR